MPDEKFFLFDQHTSQGTRKYIALSTSALQDGDFAGLTGDQLAVFLLLLSFTRNARNGVIAAEKIETLLPGGKKVAGEIMEQLENLELLSLEKTGDHYNFHLNLQALEKTDEETPDSLEQEERFLRELLSGRPVSEQELVKGLVMLLAPEKLTGRLREEIEEIMSTFSPEIVKELIRRVKKALEDNPDLKPLPYMRAIVREWLKAEIFTYDDLQKADRLHRETQELALEFGIQRFRELTPSHKEILLSWITARDNEDFALSVDVARWAIQEAIRHKRDGRPSLNYIHRNFIIPLKKERASSIDEARRILQGDKKETEEDLSWDYEKFRED